MLIVSALLTPHEPGAAGSKNFLLLSADRQLLDLNSSLEFLVPLLFVTNNVHSL